MGAASVQVHAHARAGGYEKMMAERGLRAGREMAEGPRFSAWTLQCSGNGSFARSAEMAKGGRLSRHSSTRNGGKSGSDYCAPSIQDRARPKDALLRGADLSVSCPA